RLNDLPLELHELTLEDGQLETGGINNDTFRSLTELQRLTIQRYGIQFIEPGAFMYQTQTFHLEISGNALVELKASNFIGLGSLTDLYLTGNGIKWIESGSFLELNKLEYLYLSRNDLTNIYEGMFEGLTSLKSLYLLKNSIQHIGPYAFSNLQAISRIDLPDNNLLAVANNVFSDLPLLRSLDLKRNKIYGIENQAFNATSLQKLFLQDNNLHTLSAEAIQSAAGTLNQVMASGNNIKVIFKGTFSNLTMTRVDLSYNNMELIYPGAFSNAHIELLILDTNKLPMLPSDMNEFMARTASTIITNNPWHCDCSTKWLGQFVIDAGLNYQRYKYREYLPDPSCSTPSLFRNMPLHNATRHLDKACNGSVTPSFNSTLSYTTYLPYSSSIALQSTTIHQTISSHTTTPPGEQNQNPQADGMMWIIPTVVAIVILISSIIVIILLRKHYINKIKVAPGSGQRDQVKYVKKTSITPVEEALQDDRMSIDSMNALINADRARSARRKMDKIFSVHQ
ncbi:unnamed protein product, partial [Owenia fusiformis]